MNALEFYDSIVVPTVSEFESNPTDKRRAFLACLAAFHLCDYLEPDRAKRRILYEKLRLECPQFETVERVANAFKHTVSGRRPLPVNLVYSRPPAIAGRMQAGVSRLGDFKGGVEVWGERGTDIAFALSQTLSALAKRVAASEP